MADPLASSGEPIRQLIADFNEWWQFNRDGSPNATYARVNRFVKESRAALLAVAAPPPQAEEPWQPIMTAPSARPGELVLVALIRDGVIWRVSEAAFNGLGWYTKSGEACHWRTHWMPLTAPPTVRHTRQEGS